MWRYKRCIVHMQTYDLIDAIQGPVQCNHLILTKAEHAMYAQSESIWTDVAPSSKARIKLTRPVRK
jgi:hypothetical protein